MRPSESGFQPKSIISDKELAQLTFAFRLFDHDADISFSTREAPDYRDRIMTLGVTSMSAGSRTEPGGYCSTPEALEQFEVSDERTPLEVEVAIRAQGYDPSGKTGMPCLINRTAKAQRRKYWNGKTYKSRFVLPSLYFTPPPATYI